MTSALIASSHGPDAPALAEDLQLVGVEVHEADGCPNLVQTVVQTAVDLVIIYEANPSSALFTSIAAIGTAAPRPIVVFTIDPDAEKIALATQSGVHAYVVNGYSRNRLRSVIHLAQARFRHDQMLREELTEVSQRFAERTLVDRAKGILMGARQLREEEAYRALRSAAMQSKQRIGQVSQRVIEAARYAEAINRAGQLRMLCQRLAKLYALTCAGVRPEGTRGLMADSIGSVDNILAILSRSLSKPTFGDLLDAVQTPWATLLAILRAPPTPVRLQEVDRQAEEMLLEAEQLTANLEVAGFAAALRVINVSGRQRMLSQRLAKEALLAVMLEGPAAASAVRAMAETRPALIEGLAYLDGLPLSNAEIRRELDLANQTWEAFQVALSGSRTDAGKDDIADLSEALLAHFERLTSHLEWAMQALVG